jgi:hypothetical protein
MVGHRSGPEVRAGQGDRELDQPQGRRRSSSAGQALLALRRGRCRDGLRRGGPGRHLSRGRSRSASAPTHPDERSAFPPRTSSSTRTSSPSPPVSRNTTTTAIDFIEATRIRENLPHAHVSGGVSNVSFSFRGNDRCARRCTRCSCITPSGRHGHGHRQRRPARRLRRD